MALQPVQDRALPAAVWPRSKPVTTSYYRRVLRWKSAWTATFNCGHDKDGRHFVAKPVTTGAPASHALVRLLISKVECRKKPSRLRSSNVTGKRIHSESGPGLRSN